MVFNYKYEIRNHYPFLYFLKFKKKKITKILFNILQALKYKITRGFLYIFHNS